MYVGYDTRNGKWLMIHGLDDVCMKHAKNSRTIQLVNHGGKLVIIWHQWSRQREHKSIWCAVISLEQRLTPSGNMLWGEIEWCNVILDLVHKSYKLSSCQSVLVWNSYIFLLSTYYISDKMPLRALVFSFFTFSYVQTLNSFVRCLCFFLSLEDTILWIVND